MTNAKSLFESPRKMLASDWYDHGVQCGYTGSEPIVHPSGFGSRAEQMFSLGKKHGLEDFQNKPLKTTA